MEAPATTISAPIPNFSETDIEYLKTFFTINQIYAERLSALVQVELSTHKLWGPIMASLDPEVMKAQNDANVEMQRAAIFEGKWEEYASMLLQQGTVYAQMNVSYADWYDLVARYKFVIMPYLQADYPNDIQTIIDFLIGMSKFTDYVMYAIAEAYFSEKTGLVQINADLEKKVAERTAALEASNNELESFSYSVSHDLRAPIRAINGYANILEEDFGAKFNADGMRVLNSIKRNSRKMGELIDDLLSFSRLGRHLVRMQEINMKDLVTEVITELQEDGDHPPVELNIGDLQNSFGDPTLVRQVWINLVSNALKYSRYQPIIQLTVASQQNNGMIEYSIRDNGVGFDMQYYDILFGVFQRLHSQDEFEGTGIGLAIVRKIIKRHDGATWAESKQEQGATFFFTLPSQP